MNKTVSITLGGIIFHIEENAYERLKNYLNTIKTHFNNSGDADEIVLDMEMSIAEKFNDLVNDKKQVITSSDVDKLIAVMGEVSEFESEEIDDASQQDRDEEEFDINDKSSKKKLYRDPDNQILVGVCSGLAAYFGVDVVLVRLLFVLSLLLGGSGVIVYLVLWLIMPIAKTSSQKLQMQGEQVTLAKIEEKVKKKLKKSNLQEEKHFRKLMEFPFKILKSMIDVIKKILNTLGPILRILIGSIFSLIGVIWFGMFTFIAAVATFNTDKFELYAGFSVFELTSNVKYYFTVASAYFTGILFPAIVLLLGIGLLRKKKLLNFPIASLLVALWLVAAISFGVLMIDVMPKLESKSYEMAQAEVIEKQIELTDFNAISVTGNHVLEIKEGEEFAFFVGGKENFVNALSFEVTPKQELIIGQKFVKEHWCFFHCNNKVHMIITMPSLTKFVGEDAVRATITGFNQDLAIELNNAASANITGSSEKASIVLGNASRLYWEGELENVISNINNASRLTLKGNSNDLQINTKNASRFYGFDFNVENLTIKSSGASRAEVNVFGNLKVNAHDASRITYDNTPISIESNLSDASKLIAR